MPVNIGLMTYRKAQIIEQPIGTYYSSVIKSDYFSQKKDSVKPSIGKD